MPLLAVAAQTMAVPPQLRAVLVPVVPMLNTAGMRMLPALLHLPIARRALPDRSAI